MSQIHPRTTSNGQREQSVTLRRLLATSLLGAGLLLTAVHGTAAPVYRTVDAQGNVVYTDDPLAAGAEEVELEELTIIPSTAPLGEAASATGPDVDAAPDEDATRPFELYIAAPAQEETVRSNLGEVQVRVQTNQPTRIGDVFEAFVDGQLRGRNSAGAFAFSGIDRGAHVLVVRLVDASGQELARTDQRTFYLHRVSVRNR